MKLSTLLLSGCLGWLCGGCVSNEEFRAQRAAEAQLAQQRLDKAIRDTATVPGLHALLVQEYHREEYAKALADLQLLERRYPHARILPQLKPLGQRLEALATAQQQREAAREQRRAQKGYVVPLKWQLDEYGDEFGKPSGRFSLTNGTMQRGKFSTATASNAPLVVRIIVDSSAAIRVLLYDDIPLVPHTTTTTRRHHFRRRSYRPKTTETTSETTTTYSYATSYEAMHLYTVQRPTRFVAKVRRADGRITTLPATILSDRLVFNKAASRTLHECLLAGGELDFLLTQADDPARSYRFTIANADAYEAGYYSLLRR